ncbi:MAG: GNAT family N-acetyltransferase [Candidatus Heimdallarchaeota archaeon]
MDIKTRVATFQDLDIIFQIEKACFDSDDVFHKETFEFFLAEKETIFLLAVNFEKNKLGNELIVGFIIAHPKSNFNFEIVTIDVHPDWRSKGIGTILLQETEKRISVRLQGDTSGTKDFIIELVVYENNHRAVKLYTKVGYQILYRLNNYYSRNRDGLKMSKKLLIK